MVSWPVSFWLEASIMLLMFVFVTLPILLIFLSLRSSLGWVPHAPVSGDVCRQLVVLLLLFN
jgi:hypothetical protein